MNVRTKALSFSGLLAVALAATGCGYTHSQSQFRSSFLPPAPGGSAAFEVGDPPAVTQANLFLKDTPAFLTAPPAPDRPTRGSALMERAEEQFQRGKRSYLANDIPGARREFDNAVDLMLEAGGQNPPDRTAYERRLEGLVDAIHRFDLAGMGSSAAVEEGTFEKAPLEDILQMTFPVDPRMKDKVRAQVSATVSQLPLAVNDAVLGYIQFFSNRGRKTMIAGLQRAGRYRPMIQRILDEEGVPQELIHLAQAESGFIPRALSSKAAGGMWQFLAWRGQQYGLARTPYMDERMDPEKATRAAARHLRDLYQEFGDWFLAIAAYNCGPVSVEKAVERTGYADFWELRARGVLPAETTNYVPIILAMTIMEKNAAEYGIDGVQPATPLEYDTVETAAATSLALLADIAEIPAPELAALNPALLKSVAPEGYALHVPKGSGNKMVAALQLVPAERRAAWRLHRVGPGETLAEIGKRYGASPSSIASVNNLTAEGAQPGDSLVIPAAARPEASVRKAVTRTASRRTAARRSAAKGKARPAAARSSQTAATAVRRNPSPLARTASR